MPGEISSGYVQTVLGPVAPEDLGITLPTNTCCWTCAAGGHVSRSSSFWKPTGF